MTDTLEILGNEYSGVTGIVATDSNGTDLTYVRDSDPVLQTKSVSYTPTESQQSATVVADNGYDGLSSVGVTVEAVSSTYVGSGITRRSSSDITTSGATVTTPAGYYSEQASKTLPTMLPMVSDTASGSLWTSIAATQKMTYVIFEEGYNPTERYARIAASAGKAGTPTATKGTVSNHSISVTPSVTNTEGYIGGGTKTGTAVTVSASELVSGTKSITENGAGIDVTNYASVDVNVPGEDPILQEKTNISPTESSQTITADSGYDGLSSVQINAVSSTYVGSGITQRSSSDLTASGATVTVPSGYYSAQASKAVASGTAGTPSASKGTVSNHAISVTPSVTNSTGWITGSTKTGTAVSVSASELVSGTYTVDSSGTKDVTNYASASVPSGTAGTPTASKGTVSNYSISVTPSVTNTTGFITGSTKTGTAVTVSASELVSGTLSISSSGTKDVTNYASASVPSGTEGTPTASKGTVSNHSISVTPSVTNTAGFITGSTKTGTAITVSASELVSGTKSITENGTGIDVTNYASVDVDVPSEDPDLDELTATPSGSIQVFKPYGDAINYTIPNVNSISSNPMVGTVDLSFLTYGKQYKITGRLIVASHYYTSSGQDYVEFDTLWTASEDGEISFNITTSGDANAHPNKITLSKTQIKVYYPDGTTISRGTMGYANTDTRYLVFSEKLCDGYSQVTVNAVPSGSTTIDETVDISSLMTISVNPSTGEISTSVRGGQLATPIVTPGYISSGTQGEINVVGNTTTQMTTKGATTYNTSTTDQTISGGKYLIGAQTIKAVTVSGLSANTILSGTTVKIGDANDDDRIASVSGTVTFVTYYTGTSTPSSSTGSNGDIYLKVVS